MNRTGIPTKSESEQASARASALRAAASMKRLVRIVGPDAGTYTIAQIAQRIGTDPLTASAAVRAARRLVGPGPTWAAIAERAQRAAS